jgi:DNA polymerase/3'-5' exonuclease PolX
MGTNTELADVFLEIGDLLDLGGEQFKPEAYRRAARSLQSLSEDVRAVSARGELRSIPGVGEAISEKIREYLQGGRIEYYDRIRQQYPAGLLELMRLPGIGPKTARRFWLEVGVEGPQELRDAIAAGKLTGLKGFGPRKIALIGTALATAAPTGRRTPLSEAYDLAERIVAHLSASAPLDRVAVAGSVRRRRESVGDIDILVTSREPERVFDAFSAFPQLQTIRLRGSTKETIEVAPGIQVDLRVVAPEAFGAALQYFTGSKDHNVRLRTLARDRDLKVNEYGVFRGEELVAGSTEEAVYAALGLDYVPPEIRENQGEVERATNHTLPRLVEAADLAGDLHVHLSAAASASECARLGESALARGLSYLGLVLDVGAGGTDVAHDAIDRLRAETGARLRVFRAEETGRPDAPPSPGEKPADYRILRADGPGAVPTAAAKTGGPTAALLAHLGSVERPLEPPVAGSWATWARSNGVALDIAPGRPEAATIRPFVEAGGSVHLPAFAPPGSVGLDVLAIGTARRGWTPRERVLNATSASELKKRWASPKAKR